MGKIRRREKKRGGDWQEGWWERGREGRKRGPGKEHWRPQINSLLVMLLKRSMIKFSHL